jgi:cysteine desulfurase
MNERTYLDYNASAPLRPQARAAVTYAMDAPHNASSVHGFGRAARKIVEDARSHVAALAGVPSSQLIFSSGATEANNTVLAHFSGQRVLVSAIEHPSVLEAAPESEKIPVTRDGVVAMDALETLLKQKQAALVSVMLVNNETGAIQPLSEVSALAKKYGALVHCDAVQAAGRIPLNMTEMGIDFLTLSSHKIGGPQGVGALALGICGITPVLLHGGGQEKKARAGTENVAGIAGFGAAAQCALADMKDDGYLRSLRDRLEKDLRRISPEIVLHATATPRIPGTSLFSLPGIDSQTLLMALDLEGIAVSNGAACSSGRIEASHVLKAMGMDDDLATSALRISMGWATKEPEIDRFLASWSKIYQRLKDKTKKKAHA